MRSALITGGTSGIGRGITKQLLDEGLYVHCMGFGEDHIIECKQEINSENISYYKGDIRDETFLKNVISQVDEKHGSLDVLVNCAGVYLGAGGIDEPVDRWREMLDVNLISLFSITQKSVPLLKKGQYPSIVNISSVCSLHPYSSCTSTSYSVSKAGVDLLTKRLAKELAEYGIRVNSINPGVVVSNIWRRSGTSEVDHIKWREKIKDERHPLGRIGKSKDIGNLVSFLTSDKADWMTGAIIPLDGGYSVTG